MATEARSRKRDEWLTERLVKLENDVAELELFAHTLFRMLVEKKVCSSEELAALIRAVDLEDGVADGKITREPEPLIHCPECGHHLSGKDRCIYCGFKPA